MVSSAVHCQLFLGQNVLQYAHPIPFRYNVYEKGPISSVHRRVEYLTRCLLEPLGGAYAKSRAMSPLLRLSPWQQSTVWRLPSVFPEVTSSWWTVLAVEVVYSLFERISYILSLRLQYSTFWVGLFAQQCFHASGHIGKLITRESVGQQPVDWP